MALLRRGDLSVTEVCFEVGCQSLGTFSTRFTELVGMPPSAYRREAARETAGVPHVRRRSRSRRPIRNREAPAPTRTSVIVMDITIHTTVLPHEDPDASAGLLPRRPRLRGPHRRRQRRRCAGSPSGPSASPAPRILLGPPAADPGITDDERRTITEMMAKGTFGWIMLATAGPRRHVRRRPGRAAPRSCRSRSTSPTACATARSATPPATWSASRRCAEMKTMTCKQMGGPCDQAFSGETADDVINAAGPAPQGRGRRRRHRPRAGQQGHAGPLEAPDQGDGLVQGHQEGVRRPARRLTRRSTARMHAADSHDLIRVTGARVNNLKDISVEIPKRRLTAFTGVSGLGQELAGLRDDRGGVAAADQRDLQRVRAGLHADAGAARGRRARGADDGDHRRPGADGLRPALHRRHRDRRQRDAAHPLQPARQAARRLAAGVLLQRRLDQRRRRGHPQEGWPRRPRSGAASASSAACARAARAAARSTTST